MGVRGLTTFIANRSRDYLDNYQLCDTNLVIDGNSIASQLYKWHCKCNDCFGGDYDKFSELIKHFFQLLSSCNIVPFIIFDGGYEYRKLQTVYSRMRSKIRTTRDINPINEGSVSVFPLFIREVFVDIALQLGIKCLRCDFEGDAEIAYLARTLSCPVLSYDSDFYIFDVLYIPFSNMELVVRKQKLKSNQFRNFIPCQVYRVEKFLNSFGGMDKINLPLLAVLLGNDYIKKSVFACFYQHLKIQGGKSGQSETQRRIKSVITWLKNETPESAIRKILGRFKAKRRRTIARKIQNIINGYNCNNSDILKYLRLDVRQEKIELIIPNLDEIEENESNSSAEEEKSEEESEESDNDIQVEIEIPAVEPEIPSLDLPKFFQDNFRNCLYPSCFIDMITRNTYYCIPQIEDFSQEQSHNVSLEILIAIHKILSGPDKNLICIARSGQKIQKDTLPLCEKSLPTLWEISNLSHEESRRIISEILDLDLEFLTSFPDNWHIFVIALKYWVIKSKSIDLSYIYSAVLCGILLNFVDRKIGFYRSSKAFFKKFSNSIHNEAVNETRIDSAITNIDTNNSIACMQKLIHNFGMDIKMQSNYRLFDRNIVHSFAQFQSCLLHVKYLNSLLNFPFTTFLVSDFYNGTFLYNITVNFKKRTDIASYLKILLGNCPAVVNTLELIVQKVIQQIEDSVGKSVPTKRRRRKKTKSKSIKMEVNENIGSEKSEDDYEDDNNKFSLLSVVNK